MADHNSISVIGRTTREINEKDFGYTVNGKARLNLSIAVNEGYGENKSVSYFDVVYWGKSAEAVKPYITKGKQMLVSGRLKQDRWEKDGNKYSRVYIIAESIQLLGGREDSGQSAPAQNAGGFTEGASSDFPEDIPF